MLEAIKANAELAVRQLASLKGGAFGYDEESVRWLDNYIGRIRRDDEFNSPEKRRTLVDVLGSYLGECIIRNFGGTWENRAGHWCVAFDVKNCAFPFAKVEKRFEYGEEDSIAGFFTAIPLVFARGRVSPARRPWWKFWG